MMSAAQAAADEIASDIFQMQSLCSRIEGEAFSPFGSEELTSLRQPRRNRDLCDLVDAITNNLKDRGFISLDGLGMYILTNAQSFHHNAAVVGVLALALFGLGFDSLLNGILKRYFPWYRRDERKGD